MKVFRKLKLMEALTDPTALMLVDSLEWPVFCDGIPVDMLRDMGFKIRDEWCEEVDNGV
jgi:hypothetical protein